MKHHIEKQIEILSEVCSSFDIKKADKLINDCLKAINSGNSIIATALGKNVPICEKFVGTLNSLGIKAYFMHTNSAVHGDLGIAQEGDVVIILSKSGETEETVYLCNLLKSRKTVNWLLTSNDNSASADLVENFLVLYIKHEGDPWNMVPNNSSLVFLAFLQALCMEIIERLPVSLDIFRRNHPGGHIGKMLKIEHE